MLAGVNYGDWSEMKDRTKTALLTAAVALATSGAGSAAANFDPDVFPDIPGLGDPRGLYRGGPEVEIHGGRLHTFATRRFVVPVECDSATDRGCTGVVTLRDGSGRDLSAGLRIPEESSGGAAFKLPASGARVVRSGGRWRATVTALVSDSLGRTTRQSSVITVRGRNGGVS